MNCNQRFFRMKKNLRESSNTRTLLACDSSEQPKTANIPHISFFLLIEKNEQRTQNICIKSSRRNANPSRGRIFSKCWLNNRRNECQNLNFPFKMITKTITTATIHIQPAAGPAPYFMNKQTKVATECSDSHYLMRQHTRYYTLHAPGSFLNTCLYISDEGNSINDQGCQKHLLVTVPCHERLGPNVEWG